MGAGQWLEVADLLAVATQISSKKEKATADSSAWPLINAGDDRLSHTVSRAVPWAQRGLTTVFGMGTGVTPAV